MTLALVGTVQPAGAAGSLAHVDYWLQNQNSGKCALSRGGAVDAPVVQFSCLNFNDQKWGFIYKNGGHVQIVNANSGLCLLVRGSGNEAPAVQFPCGEFADQYWRLVDFPGHAGWYWLSNVNSGKCLIVRGGNDGTQLVQFDCQPYQDQAWQRIIP